MAFNTHGILIEEDVREVIDTMIEFLEDTRDVVEEDIRDVICAGDYNNRDADDFFQTAIDVVAYGVMQGDDEGIDVLGDRRALDKVLKQAYDFSIAVFALADREISDTLSDRDFDYFKRLADTHAKLVSAIRRGGSRSRGRGGRDRYDDRRGSSRRDRGRDRDDRRDSRRDRDDRLDDRGRGRGTSRRGGRGTTSVRTNYNAGNRSPQRGDDRRDTRREEERVEPKRRTELKDATVVTQPKIVLKEKSKVVPQFEPNTNYSWMINPTEQVTVHVGTERGVFETVFEKGDNVEEYKDHEIKRSYVSTDKQGGVVVPQVDFRKLPDVGTAEAEEAAVAAKIVQVQPVSFCNTDWRLCMVGLEGKLLTDADYTIAKGDQYRPIAVPKSILSLMAGADRYSTFESWHNTMTLIQDAIPTMSRTDAFLANGYLSFLEENLQFLFNNLLAIVLPYSASLDSFIQHYHEGMKYLKSPAQADEYAKWCELEREFLRHNFAMLDFEKAAKLASEGVLYPIIENTAEIQYCWFRTNLVVVRAAGDLLADGLQFSNKDHIAAVEFKYTPDFYSACERLVAYRNRSLKMSGIVIVDSVGNQLMILAGNQSGGAIKVRKL
jgi:hypothetical protein